MAGLLRRRVAGEGEEDVVERRVVEREAATRSPSGSTSSSSARTCGGAAVGGARRARSAPASRSTTRLAEQRRGRPRTRRRRPASRSRRWPATRRLSSAAVPSATMRPPSMTAMRSASRSASSRYWVVRKTVTPAPTSSRDDLPHRLAAARVEAGGRLVEEEHRGAADEARGEVEAPAHPARVRADPAAGRRRRGRSARAARRARRRASARGEARRAGPSSAGSPRRSAARRPPRTGR